MPPPEPAASAVHALAVAASALTMSFLGVDYYSLVWGMVGAHLALFHAQETMGRVRSVIFIALSTLVGAAVGTGTLSFFSSDSRALLIVVSLVAGFGAQKIVTALLKAGLSRIEKTGGPS